MVISKIMGGLGNQMFQYAYARNLSILNDVDFYLDTSFYNNQIGVTPREFSLNRFPNTKINKNIPGALPPMQTILDNFKFIKMSFHVSTISLCVKSCCSSKLFIGFCR